MEYLSDTDATDRRRPLSKAEVIREWHNKWQEAEWISGFSDRDEIVARDPRVLLYSGGRSPAILSKADNG